MTATVTLELPENVLIQALRQLPPARRQALLHKVEGEKLPKKALEATRPQRSTLDRALGLLATDRIPPTDAEIEQMLAERRLEKSV